MVSVWSKSDRFGRTMRRRNQVREPKTEAEFCGRLNKLAERERQHERERGEVFRGWVEARRENIRQGIAPGDFPVLRDGEFEWVARREQLLRDRLADDPVHQQAIRQVNELNAS